MRETFTYNVQIKTFAMLAEGRLWDGIEPIQVISTHKKNGFFQKLYDYLKLHNQLNTGNDKIYEIRFVENGSLNGNYVSCDGEDFAEAYEMCKALA